MKTPRVSLCLPNLNTRPFLEERIATILAQTFTDWELVISDNHSDDGAWEYFQEVARRDPRIRLSQAPREGMYANWNRCIRQARGDYVYIATSDDTMAPDCIEQLVHALDAHADCDIAHCDLKVIDEKGRDLPGTQQWWNERSLFARSSGPLRNQPHIRRAPWDGVLLLTGDTVFISLTQLLIRRTLFDRVGLFEARWGSPGDFNWDLRASLVANAVHVPGTWGSWRLHPHQATAAVRVHTPEFAAQIAEMIDHALETCGSQLAPEVRHALEQRWVADAAELRRFITGYRTCPSGLARKRFVLGRLLGGSRAAWAFFRSRFSPPDRRSRWIVETIHGWMQRTGAGRPVVGAAGGRT